METVTRRKFIMAVSQVGGVAAAVLALQGMGLDPAFANEPASVLNLKPDGGKGIKVVVLGAGMAGLAAAYELRRGGYDVTVLEGRDRPTGRAWTIRPGDKVEFTDGTTQLCNFDTGHYLNPGPARIPSHHQTLLGYVRELNVPIEVEVNVSRSAFMWNKAANEGTPLQLRRVMNDTRGYVSELLAKSVNKNALDQELTGLDKEKFVSFLRQYGDLSPDLFYKGSARSGYKQYPGAHDVTAINNDPLTLKSLLDQDMWQQLLFEESMDQQATMFQPVGGIDAPGRALAKSLGKIVKLNSQVTEIRRNGTGVKIVYKDTKTGKAGIVEADYMISTIATHLLSRIPNDLPADIQSDIAKTSGGDGMKIGFESRRFWEQDYNIYGGISQSKDPRAAIWHQTGGFHTKRGITVFYGGAPEFGKLPLDQQIAGGRAAIDGIYPGHGAELDKAILVQWSKVSWNEGTGAHFTAETAGLYDRLNKGEAPFFFAADYLSHVSGWQEGAIRSGHYAVSKIATRVAELETSSNHKPT